MTDPQDSSHPDGSPPDRSLPDGSAMDAKRLLVGLLGLLVVAGCAWAVFSFRSQKLDSEQALSDALANNAQLQQQMANLQETVADIKTANLYQQEEEILAKDELSVILKRTADLEQELQTLADAQTRWETAIGDLKENQTGRRLASDAALVDLLEAILSSSPEAKLASELNGRLQPLQQQLREAQAAESVSFKPTEAFLTRVDEIEEAADKTQQWYRDHLLQLDALQAQADELEPAERTLRAALLGREAERAQERVTTQAERNRQAQQEADATIGKAEAEAQRMIAEAEAKAKQIVGDATAKGIMQAAQEQKAIQEEAIRKRKAEEELAQLKRDYQRDLPDIKVKLKPFLADGFTYNGDSGRKGPVSLSTLRGQGALEEGRKGLERLLYIGGTTTNDRDRGGFPQFVGGDFAWRQLNKDFLVKAQDYLNTYGALLVENKLLAP